MDSFDRSRYIFDADWYARSGPVSGDPFHHFATVGWREHRDPHPLFDTAYYLAQVEGDLPPGVDALSHFIEQGAPRGLSPHPLFDVVSYERRYRLNIADENPLIHFLKWGDAGDFDPHLLFFSKYYLEHNPDVIASGMNPLVHYVRHGHEDTRRRPHPLFHPLIYTQRRGLAKDVNPLMDHARRLTAMRRCTAPRPAAPRVSVVVLNLDNALLTLECAVQAMEAIGTAGDVELIVVDNGSRPNDFEHLVGWLPPFVNLVRVGVNRYFGEGNNLGFEAARGEFVLFLNNDAFIEPSTIPTLLRVFETHPDAGAVGPTFIYPDGRIQEAGAMISSCGTALQRAKFLNVVPSYLTGVQPVDYISAACVLVRSADFDRIGGFDLTWEPAYYEDADLCLKLEVLGRRTYHTSDAVVTHIENATSSNAELRLNTVVSVNRQKFISRWGAYLAGARDPKRSLVGLPEPLREPVGTAGTAVVYTPYPLSPGGGERYVLSVAARLSRRYRTFVVVPDQYSRFRLRQLGEELDLDLGEIRIALATDLPQFAGCDVFFAMGNEVLPPIRAFGRRKIFHCQFPFSMDGEQAARMYGNLAGYDRVVVASPYVKRHYEARIAPFGPAVPPVVILPSPCPSYTIDRTRKLPGRILNIGRFAAQGHNKHQDALVRAFRRLVERTGRTDLELCLAGTVGPSHAHRDYFEYVRTLAAGLPVTFHINVPSDTLRELFETSSFYWHATGFDENETLFPERQEHFGITVVEALSCGAIPFVYGAGGPAATVEPGITGYHWRTEDGLAALQAAALESDAALGADMRAAGEIAARTYDMDMFNSRVDALIDGIPVPGSANGSSSGAVVHA
jgi:GT2 family glycosyltransferase/glycosyltransferase involved in cell wall biosynthesis